MSEPHRLLVFGDRRWTDSATVGRVLDEQIARHGRLVVIEGEARGADSLARLEAERRGIPVEAFAADWRRYGRGAGPVRNEQMLREGRPDEAVGFHPCIAQSKGSADMRRRCERAGVPVQIVRS